MRKRPQTCSGAFSFGGKKVKQAEERQDYLPGNERVIHQRSDIFTYSMDAVLLARFVRVSGAEKAADLCSGTGAVPLVMSLRTEAVIDALELQPLLCELTERSIKTNNLEKQVRVMERDLRDLSGFALGKYDLVTCNPPYFPVTAEKGVNVNTSKTLARHEVSCTLDDAVKAAAALVKSKGRAAFVHRPERLGDIITTMQKRKLEPKRLCFVHPREDRPANILLIEAVKDGNPGMTTEPPWIVYDKEGNYTPEFYEHYFKGGKSYA
ncbi:SAM-dependent methyltransferase [Alkalicoccus saliphilus]|uniref:SAM-dependent methyltransferase n=1 Tax=Alkalicoccus saliphilus TaxID=200989 RepID=A0A2T4U444_9BACI|nr:SAM-dependent methyltransferase [Alkalicoccus saliphilus]